MENPAWLFAVASVIAVGGIAWCYRQMMNAVSRMANQPSELNTSFQNEQTRFFIKVAIVDALPLLIVVYGFVLLNEVQEPLLTEDIIIPLVIAIASLLLGLIIIFSSSKETLSALQQTQGMSEKIKAAAFTGVGVMAAIPIISIVACMLLIS